jgi:exopolysaccharide biosynthesis protein
MFQPSGTCRMQAGHAASRPAAWVRAMLAVVAFGTGIASAAPVVTHPYLGITRITDTLNLSAPADQTFQFGVNLGAHVANINLVKIDLDAPGLSFKVSPGNGTAPNETVTQRTLGFMAQENAQLAVNAHFFTLTNANAAVGTTLTGFAASNGTVYSPFEPAPLPNALLPYALTAGSPALNISATNEASILGVGATTTSLAGGVVPYNAVSGSAQIITAGAKSLPQIVATVTEPGQILVKNVPPFGGAALGNWYTDQIAGRTAMGLSADNRTLYIFTADATGGSNGMTVSEVADYLLGQGAYNVINLDGGGSTTLAMEDPLTGVDGVINAVSGSGRFVGSSLAVFAAPVPEPSTWLMFAMGGFAVVVGVRRRTMLSA